MGLIHVDSQHTRKHFAANGLGIVVIIERAALIADAQVKKSCRGPNPISVPPSCQRL